MKKYQVTVKFKDGNTLTRIIPENEYNNLLSSEGIKEGYLILIKSCEIKEGR